MSGGKKIPYHIKLKDQKIFSFVGLWGDDENKIGEVTKTFSIITTEANELVSEIHNRMLVILKPSDESECFSDISESEAISFLTPYSAEDITSSQVSIKINNPKYNNVDILNSA